MTSQYLNHLFITVSTTITNKIRNCEKLKSNFKILHTLKGLSRTMISEKIQNQRRSPQLKNQHVLFISLKPVLKEKNIFINFIEF